MTANQQPAPPPPTTSLVMVHSGRAALAGDLTIPIAARGIIVFAHGSGSGRLSPRNRRVARSLVHAGFATLVFDLLTREEEVAERYTHHLRFDIALLADRLVGALEWVATRPDVRELPIGVFGASTGASAALIAATRTPAIRAIVSRGGRPDLAEGALPQVRCPTLLIVGGDDPEVVDLNVHALERMTATRELHVVRGASHLFEEPGALEEVTTLASIWFQTQLPATPPRHRSSPAQL